MPFFLIWQKGIIAVDIHQRITIMNQAAKQYFSIDEGYIGQSFHQMVKQPELTHLIETALDTQSVIDIDVSLTEPKINDIAWALCLFKTFNSRNYGCVISCSRCH